MKIFIENELIEELYVCNADYIEFKDYVEMLIETNETFQCKLFEFGFENYRYVIKFKITRLKNCYYLELLNNGVV
jgi:hypothetical protein